MSSTTSMRATPNDAPRDALPLPIPEQRGETQWIDSDAALDAACARWRGADVIAIDTEFVRERTFFPALGLVQLSVGDPFAPEVALIDGVAVRDLGPLTRLLSDPGMLKILHSPGEDFGVFQHAAGMTPAPVFDTQIGAAFAGFGYALGYSSAVEAVFSVHLPKEAQRTNWLRRPLSEAQLVYAARDVLYLPALHRYLHHRLDAQGRIGWVLEDSERLADVERMLPSPDQAWRKVKGTGGLDAAGRGSLEALAAWREGEARQRDLPRGFVIRDDVLVSLAAERPKSPPALEQSRILSDPLRRRYGTAVLQVLQSAPRKGTPPPKRPSFDPRPIVNELKTLVAERATDLDIPPEALASRKHLEALVLRIARGEDRPLPRSIRGWREPVIGEALTERAQTLVANAR